MTLLTTDFITNITPRLLFSGDNKKQSKIVKNKKSFENGM
jgi:hypothetical protein